MEFSSRYTGRARLVTYLARLEARRSCSASIEPEHLLLGLLLEAPEMVAHCAGAGQTPASLIRTLAGRIPAGNTRPEKLPLSAAGKRVLQQAAAQAKGQKSWHVGTEHLLLGLVSEPAGSFGTILADVGLHFDGVQRALAEGSAEAAGIRKQLRKEALRSWRQWLLAGLKTISAIAFACQTWLVLGLFLGDSLTPLLLRALLGLDLAALAWPLAVGLPKLFKHR